MKIRIIPAAQLTQDLVSAWSGLQRSNQALASPFFRPEFTLAVAAERRGVNVAVLEERGEPVGFLPFERSRWGSGQATGAFINEFQGAIVRSDVEWEPRVVVRAAGLRHWRFDHLAAAQSAFAPYRYVFVDSPYLDLSQGFEHYRKSRGKSAARFLAQISYKERKASREIGEVRLDVNPADRGALGRLIHWKREQCTRNYTRFVYDFDWLNRLHDRCLDQATDDFAGMLFSLYMGNRLAACCFGIRSHGVMQGSILGYDRELKRYAPGLVLVSRMAQAANALGITRIDMGSGRSSYKDSLASGYFQIAEGVIPAQPALDRIHCGWFRAKQRLRATWLRKPAGVYRRWIFSTRALLGYEG
jgi:CelD/BcsL family acetyltransferase involved in cellulose biosynthesis